MLKEAGPENMAGAITADVYKDPNDPQWNNDKGMIDYKAFMHKYYPEGDVKNRLNIQGYVQSQVMVAILKKAGDNLTRANIMNLVKNMNLTSHDISMLLPGDDIHTSPTAYEMFSKAILMQFNGHTWVPVPKK
jgi:branched-chain amino acid transport system substrate-binding protein